MKRPHLLVLGGTREAVSLVQRVVPLWKVTTSFGWSRVRLPGSFHHIGGWGGVEGLCQYLLDRSIEAVIDATHPFSIRISRSVGQACGAVGIPCLRLERARWSRHPDDRWIEVSDFTTAAQSLPPSRRVLLTIGRRELRPFAVRDDLDLIARTFEPDDSFENIVMIRGRRYSDLDWEYHLLKRYKIDWMVTKNSGGEPWKLIAARHLGIPIVMIDRPEPLEDGVKVRGEVEEGLRWLEAVYHRIIGRSR